MSQSSDLLAPSSNLPDASDTVRLAAQHLELVKILAAKLFRLRWADGIPFDDYYQSGVVGLLEAAGRFDASVGVKFSTFASPRITGAILNSLVHASELNEQGHMRKRLLAQRIAAIAEVPADAGETHAAEEDDPFVRIAEAAIGLAIGFMLEESGMYQSGEGLERRDGYRGSALRETRERLHALLRQLTERERQIIERHYYLHMDFQEIAAELGITRGRVSQLHTTSIARLRAALGHNVFDDFEA